MGFFEGIKNFFEKVKQRNMKGIIGDLQQGAIMLVILTVIIGIGSLINSNVLSQVTTSAGQNSYAANATTKAVQSLYDLSSWLPIVVVVFVGILLIGLMLRGFSGVRGSAY